MIRVAFVLGSTRPGRNGEAVARWAFDIARKRKDAEYEFIDLKDYNLPLLDEPVPPMMGQYMHDHTKAWAERIDSFDAFVFVTPEYNHGTSAALKNALDYLYKEWNNKAAGFISYGRALGARAVEQLRLVMGELRIADVRSQVALSLYADFDDMSKFKPSEGKEKDVLTLLDDVVAWGAAMQWLRNGRKTEVRDALMNATSITTSAATPRKAS
jgi:NAD(P)H-dependent FMN reductase